MAAAASATLLKESGCELAGANASLAAETAAAVAAVAALSKPFAFEALRTAWPTLLCVSGMSVPAPSKVVPIGAGTGRDGFAGCGTSKGFELLVTGAAAAGDAGDAGAATAASGRVRLPSRAMADNLRTAFSGFPIGFPNFPSKTLNPRPGDDEGSNQDRSLLWRCIVHLPRQDLDESSQQMPKGGPSCSTYTNRSHPLSLQAGNLLDQFHVSPHIAHQTTSFRSLQKTTSAVLFTARLEAEATHQDSRPNFDYNILPRREQQTS